MKYPWFQDLSVDENLCSDALKKRVILPEANKAFPRSGFTEKEKSSF